MEAFTVNLCYYVRPLSWNAIKSKWSHLKKIKFPNGGPKSIIDIQIGVDFAHLHCGEIEITGEPNKLNV